jgi:glycosyltransferase involved in cell wall biosynthesis
MLRDSVIKVSVIIPCYNAEHYIRETLQSVYQQGYSNIEVVVIDDHSTDNSYELVKALKLKNLILKKNPKKGACSARNYGFELSTGDFIQYLDADDLLSPTKLDNQIELATKFGNDFIYSCQWVRFIEKIDENDTNIQLINKDYNEPYLWLNDSWKGKGMAAVHSWLVPRKIVVKAGLWNENLLINQDGEFFSRIILNARGIKYAPIPKVYYRSGNPNSITQSQKLSRAKSHSLLNSYILYKKTSIKYNRLDDLKLALGNNFLMFIYQNYDLNKDLADQAIREFYDLGFKKMWTVGGGNFKRVANIIGFENTLKGTKVLKKLYGFIGLNKL